MKTRTQVEMRMEFLELGERLGFPRIGFGPGRRVRPGEESWTAFASKARLQQIAPALRNARILAGYYVTAESMKPKATPDEVMAKRRAGLEKARLARSAKVAARRAAKEAELSPS